MTFDSFKWTAEKLGIPTLFCVALCFAIYRTGSWAAINIGKPVVDKHIEFIDTEQKSMKVIADNSTKQTENMERQSKQMEQHTVLLETIADTSRDIKRSSEQIMKDQRLFPAVAEKMP